MAAKALMIIFLVVAQVGCNHVYKINIISIKQTTNCSEEKKRKKTINFQRRNESC